MTIRGWWSAWLAVIVAVAALGCATAGTRGAVLVTVNGERLYDSDLQERLNLFKFASGGQFDPAKERDNVLRSMVEEALLVQEATRRKIRPDREALGKWREQVQQVLLAQAGAAAAGQGGQTAPAEPPTAATLKQEMAKASVTQRSIDRLTMQRATIEELFETVAEGAAPSDADLRAHYDANPAEFEQVRASHILVASEDEARRIAAEARADPARFPELARRHSTDTASKERGGDLGAFGRGQMVPQFEEAAFSLPVGQISEPVQSQFGWHVIRVEERARTPFEQVRDSLREMLKRERGQAAFDELLDDLRAGASVNPPDWLQKPS